MSIRDQIQALVDREELFSLESRMFGYETPRTLFVSQELMDAFVEPFPTDRAVLWGEFRENLDAFLEGGEMSVGEDPFDKWAYALMARVHPPGDEFWDFRV